MGNRTGTGRQTASVRDRHRLNYIYAPERTAHRELSAPILDLTVLPRARSLLDAPRGNPKHPRRRDGINSPPPPPADFVSGVMVVAVMRSAQRHRELVADLAPHRARLSEPQMVGVRGTSPADQTRLGCNELEVSFVAMAAHLANGELAFVDFGGISFGLSRRRSRRVFINGWL